MSWEATSLIRILFHCRRGGFIRGGLLYKETCVERPASDLRPPKNVSPQGIAFEASFFSQLYATTPSILGQDIFECLVLIFLNILTLFLFDNEFLSFWKILTKITLKKTTIVLQTLTFGKQLLRIVLIYMLHIPLWCICVMSDYTCLF